MPYELTRVCLQPIRGVEGSDYINASFLDGYRSACFSLLPHCAPSGTLVCFWLGELRANPKDQSELGTEVRASWRRAAL